MLSSGDAGRRGPLGPGEDLVQGALLEADAGTAEVLADEREAIDGGAVNGGAVRVVGFVAGVAGLADLPPCKGICQIPILADGRPVVKFFLKPTYQGTGPFAGQLIIPSSVFSWHTPCNPVCAPD